MRQISGSVIRTILILGGVFLFMLAMNHWMPIHRDDYDYSLIWGTTQHVASLDDVFQSMENHYLTHGGRMVTVFVLDFFLWLGKAWFDLANAAVFTGIVVLLYCHSTRGISLTKEPGTMALAAFLLWLCLPHFGEVAVWKSGSTVYLWSGFLAALFLLPYNLFLAGRVHWGAGMALPMFFLGILGGWSVENLAVTVVCLSGGISFYAWKKHRGQAWLPAGAAGALLGLAGLLAAPGNYVRYDSQGSGKGILIHIGNQFAGNGEMLMYLLPVILLLLLAWRILKAQYLTDRGGMWTRFPGGMKAGQGIVLFVMAVLVFSYFSGGFIGDSLRDFLIAHLLVPLHLDRPKAIAQFSHVMEGFEEMAVFWTSVFLVYSLAKRALGFDAQCIRRLNREVKAGDLCRTYPEVRFAGIMIGLCFFNNLVMLAAPTFPARATFSSVFMFLMAVLAVLRMPPIRSALAGRAGRMLRIGGGAIGGFLAVSALLVAIQVTEENNARIADIVLRQGTNEVVCFPPMETQNRALRHVFFVDFDNGITKRGVCNFYGIKDIEVVPHE